MTRHPAVAVMVVRTDGSVGWRMGAPAATSGLFVVADCAACDGAVASGRHTHRQWRVQTESGYLVGDMSLGSRREAQDAAAALGSLAIDWRDPALAVHSDPATRETALAVLARWGSLVRRREKEADFTVKRVCVGAIWATAIPDRPMRNPAVPGWG